MRVEGQLVVQRRPRDAARGRGRASASPTCPRTWPRRMIADGPAHARARGLVPALRRLSPLLPEPPPALGGVCPAGGRPSISRMNLACRGGPVVAPLSRSAKDRNLPRRSRLERLSRSTHVPRACWRFSCRPRAVPSTPAGIMRRRDRPARSAAMAPGEPYRDRTPAAAFSLRISPAGARASRARACERRLPRASGRPRSHWRR